MAIPSQKKINILALAGMLAIFFWVIDSFIDHYLFKTDSWDKAFWPIDEPVELWMRCLVTLLIIASGVIGHRAHIKQAVVEKKLRREIAERNNAEQALRANEKAIHELYKLASESSIPLEQRIQRLLRQGTDYFGMKIGIFSKITGNEYQVVQAVSPDNLIKPGTVYPLGKTYCQVTLSNDDPVSFEEAGATEWASHPAYEEFKLEAYIGTKIIVSNTVYGTLNFSNPEPLSKPVKQSDLDIIQLMGEWLGSEMTREMVDEKLRQSAALVENANEGVILTDTEETIVAVNPAFSEILGYREEEVLGKNPRMLKSGVHNKAFYCDMWQKFLADGKWQGELVNRHKSGKLVPVWANCSIIRDENHNPTHYLTIFSDISSIKQYEERLSFMAHHDPLTGLANRLLFTIRLDHALEQARRHKKQIALLFIDLDNFKDVNDNLGHAAGDQLLQALAKRFTHLLREEDTAARLGGDEFVVIVEDAENINDLEKVAEKLLSVFVEPFEIDTRVMKVTCSIGIAVYPEHGFDSESLLKAADNAMYSAKRLGKNRSALYSPEN